MAFNDAMTDLTTGRIDYAVVGGASGIFRPQTSIAFQRLHMMSPDVRALASPFRAAHLYRMSGLGMLSMLGNTSNGYCWATQLLEVQGLVQESWVHVQCCTP